MRPGIYFLYLLKHPSSDSYLVQLAIMVYYSYAHLAISCSHSYVAIKKINLAKATQMIQLAIQLPSLYSIIVGQLMRLIDAIVNLILIMFYLYIQLHIQLQLNSYSTESCSYSRLVLRKLMPYSCAQIGVCMFMRLQSHVATHAVHTSQTFYVA